MDNKESINTNCANQEMYVRFSCVAVDQSCVEIFALLPPESGPFLRRIECQTRKISACHFFCVSPCADDRMLHQCMSESPRCRTLPLQNASLDECATRLLQRTAYETRENLLKDFTFSRGDSFDLQTFSRPKESTTFRKESRSLSIFGDIVPFSANLSISNDV